MEGYKGTRSPARPAISVALPLLLLAIAVAACGGPYRFGAATFADDQHGWVTGWDGDKNKTVLTRTSDAGATWAQVGARSTQSNAPVAGWAEFASPTVGVWAVGLNKLLYTTTGGRPWRAAAVRNVRGARFTAQSYFSAANFTSARVGYATLVKGQSQPAGAKGGWIARTRNGGTDWRIKKGLGGKGADYGGFVDVAAPTPYVCFALKVGTRGGVWATTDSGRTWRRHILPGDTKSYEAIDFTDAQTGWAVGAAGMMAKTSDGGLTWTALVSGVDVRLHGVCFLDVRVGYAVGEYGVIIVSQDGGATWTPQASGWVPDSAVEDDNLILNDVDFVSATEGWIVAAGGWTPGQAKGLLHTTDGQTWTFVP